MATERSYSFEAENRDLVVYNTQAILNLAIYYVFDDDNETIYTFPGYVSSFLNVYDSDERNQLVKSYTTQITRNSNVQVINTSISDMTFDQSGTYYYELGYFRSGYDIVLRYGKFIVK